ncbi:MAG: hypothetical protein KJ767_03320 [Nanoarchaeota archaeon]|nr:hypothetical protein [Nanoarchaeota archaeon]
MEQTQECTRTFNEALDTAIEFGYIPKENTRLTPRQKKILELMALCEKKNKAIKEYNEKKQKDKAQANVNEPEHYGLHEKDENTEEINQNINRQKAREYFFPAVGPYNPRH